MPEITKTALKNKILSYGCFADNQYLSSYVDLIYKNLGSPAKKFKTQRHHIVPRTYFTINALSVDNSSSNIVNLLYKDHILAHYYLCLCAKEKNFKIKCQNAFVKMISLNKDGTYSYWQRKSVLQAEIKIDDIDLEQYQIIHEEYHRFLSEKMSKMQKGVPKPPRNEEYRRHISESHKGHQVTLETRKKISQSKKGKKLTKTIKFIAAINKHKKPVLCVETGEVYPSATEAEQQTGLYHIGERCHKGTPTGGRHWKYISKEEYERYARHKNM